MDGWVFVMLVLCRILRFGPLDFFPLKILMRHVHCTIQISLAYVLSHLDGTVHILHQIARLQRWGGGEVKFVRRRQS